MIICLRLYGSKLYSWTCCFQKSQGAFSNPTWALDEDSLSFTCTPGIFVQEKPHLQRNISHVDRPHPSQSKLLPPGLQIIRSQFIDHGISRLFPLAGQNEKHRIQWTFKKKTQSSTKTKNLFRNTIEKFWTTNLAFLEEILEVGFIPSLEIWGMSCKK